MVELTRNEALLRLRSLSVVEGRNKTRKWQKNGVDHYSTEVIADDMLMLGSRAEAQGQQAADDSPPASNDQPLPSVSSLDDFEDVPF